jgi:AcrR family transcriptional regulator
MLDGGRTVKELAEALGVPPTRLYYHVKILEHAGLIEVVERRMVSGIEERTYRAIESRWAFGEDDQLGTVDDESAVIKAVLGAVHAEIDVVIHDHPDERLGLADSPVPIFTLTDLVLTAAEVAEVQETINALNEKFAVGRKNPPADARRYHFLFAGYRRPEVPSA